VLTLSKMVEPGKRAAGVILVNKTGDVLLQLRDNKPNIPHPGVWSIVSGGIEPGESALEAVKREIREELNCEANNVKFMKEMFVEEVDIDLSIFKGNLDVEVDDIDLTEGQEVRYFKIEEIEELDIPEFLKDFIYENKDKI
jgi:8-oxo-dGTP diphosphatase